MHKYAQLDENNTVVGISDLSGEVTAANMILINDRPDIGFGWRHIDSEWLEPLPVEEPYTPPEPTNTEVMQTLSDIQIDLMIMGAGKNV